MRTHHLAQINVSRMLAPLESPVMAGFVAELDAVNAMADRSPGFVWRFQTVEGNATYVRPFDDDRIIVNVSVWESVEALRSKGLHGISTAWPSESCPRSSRGSCGWPQIASIRAKTCSNWRQKKAYVGVRIA